MLSELGNEANCGTRMTLLPQKENALKYRVRKAPCMNAWERS